MPDSISNIDWHIAGLGSIAALSNAFGLRHDLNMQPIVRENSQSFCTHFVDLNNDKHVLSSPTSLGNISTINKLLVPLKSYDVVPFLAEVTKKLAPNAQVVLCHNGMGTIDKALSLLPSSANLYFCTTNNGVFKQDRVAHYAGAGDSFWQLVKQGNQNKLTTNSINQILPNAIESNDLEKLLWQKLIVNCAINPLTAIHQVKNGQLAKANFQPIINDIVKEAVLVANAEGIDITFVDMLNKVHTVITQTSENNSSMFQDVLHKRETEIEFITGYLLESATNHNLKLKTNLDIYQQVKTL